MRMLWMFLFFTGAMSWAQEGLRGFILGPLTLRAEPAYDAAPTVTLTAIMTKADIEARHSKRFDQFYKVRTAHGSGWISSILWMNEKGADITLINLTDMDRYGSNALEWELFYLLKRYAAVFKYLPQSTYRPYAMYRYGKVAQALGDGFTRKIRTTPGIRGKDKKMFIEQCRQLGLEFHWDSERGYPVYKGEIFHTLLKEHPKSEWAGHAAWELLVPPGDIYPQGKEGLTRTLNWIERYPTNPLLPKALYLLVYLHCAETSLKPFPTEEERKEMNLKARSYYERLLLEYPESPEAAKARFWFELDGVLH